MQVPVSGGAATRKEPPAIPTGQLSIPAAFLILERTVQESSTRYSMAIVTELSGAPQKLTCRSGRDGSIIPPKRLACDGATMSSGFSSHRLGGAGNSC